MKRKREIGEENRARNIIRRFNQIRACRLLFLTRRPLFHCYEEDIWIEIAKYLGGKSLVKLGLTNRWFHRLIFKEDCVWKFACLRDLRVPDPGPVCFRWIDLYAWSFVKLHSYMFRQSEKHLAWMRLGAFFFDSPIAVLTGRMLSPPKMPLGESLKEMLQISGSGILHRVKTGIWIADLHLIRCPVCDIEDCEGTMQMLDARHIELFLSKEYRNGSWEYEEIGSHIISDSIEGATGGIFDFMHRTDHDTRMILDLKSWGAKEKDCIGFRFTRHAVAVNTSLKEHYGLLAKYYTMRSSATGEVVSIRISQQIH